MERSELEADRVIHQRVSRIIWFAIVASAVGCGFVLTIAWSFAIGAAAAAVAPRFLSAAPAPAGRVAIARLNTYGPAVLPAMERLFDQIGEVDLVHWIFIAFGVQRHRLRLPARI